MAKDPKKKFVEGKKRLLTIHDGGFTFTQSVAP